MIAKLVRPSFWMLLILMTVLMLLLLSCPPGTYVTVTFDANGGTPASPGSTLVRAGGLYGSLATSTRTGYTLVGWFTAAGQTGIQVTKDTILEHDESHTLYAHWTPTVYNITYHLDGGVNNGGNPATYSATNLPINLLAPTRVGYDFLGWSNQADSADYVDEIPTSATGDLDIYANWETGTYQITFDPLGGVASFTTKQVTAGSTYGLLPFCSKTGYDFGGWYDGLGETADQITSGYTVLITDDQTLYAKWTASSYAITYDLYGGTNHAGNPANYTILDTPITLSNPTRTGHTFLGWFNDSGFSQATTGITTGTTGAKKFYAKWVASTFTVTYDSDGGNESPVERKVMYGKAYTYNPDTSTHQDLPSATKDGHSFLGWRGADDLGEEIKITGNSIVEIAANHTLYAKHMGQTASGGYVYYDKGYASDGWRYLEAGPATMETYFTWGPTGTDYGINLTNQADFELGAGKANTATLAAIPSWNGETDYPATYCANLESGGYSDWYLPSIQELKLIYSVLHARGLGDFGENAYSSRMLYWTSNGGKASSQPTGDAFYVTFFTGQQNSTGFGNVLMVRPVRSYE